MANSLLKQVLDAVKTKKQHKCIIEVNEDRIEFIIEYEQEVDKLSLFMEFDRFSKLNLLTTETKELTDKQIEDYIKGTGRLIDTIKKHIKKVDYSYKALGVEEDRVEGVSVLDRLTTTDPEDIEEIIRSYCTNDVGSMYNFITAFSKSVINTYADDVKRKIKKKQMNT